MVRERKGEFREVLEELRKAGFSRVRINGELKRLEDETALDKKKKHTSRSSSTGWSCARTCARA